MKKIKYKAYRNCIWIIRINTGENYAETMIATSEDVSTSGTVKLKKNIIKAALKPL